jgi:hypothetical protein
MVSGGSEDDVEFVIVDSLEVVAFVVIFECVVISFVADDIYSVGLCCASFTDVIEVNVDVDIPAAGSDNEAVSRLIVRCLAESPLVDAMLNFVGLVIVNRLVDVAIVRLLFDVSATGEIRGVVLFSLTSTPRISDVVLLPLTVR